MRRDSKRGKNRDNEKLFDNKLLMTGCIALLLVAILIVSIILYSRQLNLDNNSEVIIERLSSTEQNKILEQNNTITAESTESVSSSIGKNVEESKANSEKDNEKNKANNIGTKSNSKKTTLSTKKKTNANTENDSEKEKEEVVKKELSFIQPVEGEIIKEFAKDNLIYSKTLEEWVTHLGIDIKSDKTTVVKAAEDGVVRSIKNDPRYGLTVVINHDEGYQTVYANLLTAEFISEGESVSKGQTIGTVGNTATFEIADESHLHFEILKDSENLDPNICIKDNK